MFFMARSWAADEEIVALLARMAENVSFALENFDREDERRRAEVRAHYLATHDDLTDLPNRAMFSQMLNAAIGSRSVSIASSVSCSSIWIVSSSSTTPLGHAAGDIVLKGVASQFDSACATVTCWRVSGATSS